jgi:hypothetical protein
MTRLARSLTLARRWRRLPAAERRFAAHVALLLAITEALLVWVRPGVLLRRDVRLAGASRIAPLRAASLIEAVATSHPGAPRCLARAIVGHWTLRGSGIDTEVVIGCARTAPFEAHAWLRGGGVTWLGGETAAGCREIHVFAGEG